MSEYKNESKSLEDIIYENNSESRFDKIKEYTLIGSGITGLVLGALAGYTILSTAVGAFMGEILDHIPYFNTAIPKAIEELTRSSYFYGNLDKLGAALGFIGSFFRAYTPSHKSRTNCY